MSKWASPGFPEAECARLEPSEADRLFFQDGRAPREAVLLCRSCRAQEACRDYARKQRIEFGVWGGESAVRRAALVGARQVARVHGEAFASFLEAR